MRFLDDSAFYSRWMITLYAVPESFRLVPEWILVWAKEGTVHGSAVWARRVMSVKSWTPFPRIPVVSQHLSAHLCQLLPLPSKKQRECLSTCTRVSVPEQPSLKVPSHSHRSLSPVRVDFLAHKGTSLQRFGLVRLSLLHVEQCSHPAKINLHCLY